MEVCGRCNVGAGIGEEGLGLTEPSSPLDSFIAGPEGRAPPVCGVEGLGAENLTGAELAAFFSLSVILAILDPLVIPN